MRSPPLVPEDTGRVSPRAGRELIRSAVAALVARARDGDPSAIARELWPGGEDRQIGLLTRSPVSPTSRTSASALVPTTVVNDFLASLTAQSAAAALLSRVSMRFDTPANLLVPSILPSAGDAAFVGEGKPIPGRQLVFGNVLLSPNKLAVITSYTGEILSYTAGAIETIVGQTLREAAALALDAAMFDDAPGDGTRPPGLRHGIPALTAATGTDALRSDIAALAAAVSPVSGGRIMYIAAPAEAVTLALHPGGFPFPLASSAALAPGVVLAIAVNAVAAAIDPTPRFDTSKHAVLHQEDTTPLAIGSPGVEPDPSSVAAPVTSLFQVDAIAMRMILQCDWALRHPSGLAWLNAEW